MPTQIVRWHVVRRIIGHLLQVFHKVVESVHVHLWQFVTWWMEMGREI